MKNYFFFSIFLSLYIVQSSDENVSKEYDETSKDNVKEIDFNTDKLEVVDLKVIRNKKFRAEMSSFKFKINRDSFDKSNPKFLTEIFDHLLLVLKKNVGANDKLGLTIDFSDNRKEASNPIGVPFNYPKNISSELILDIFESVAQSNTNFLTSDSLFVQSTHIKGYEGGSKTRRPTALMSVGDILEFKKCLLNIPECGNENLCLISSVLAALEILDGVKPHLIARKVKRHRFAKLQQDLIKKAGMSSENYANKFMGLEQIHKLQNYFQHKYRLVIYNDKNNPNSFLFKGPQKMYQLYRKLGESAGNAIKDLNIYYSEEERHFYPIISVSELFGRRKLCKYCDILVFRSHVCKASCAFCWKFCVGSEDEPMIECNECNRYFSGEKCLENHRQRGTDKKSVCEKVKFCQDCNKIYNLYGAISEHRCDHYICRLCKNYVSSNGPHPCFMEPFNFVKDLHFMLIFFDFETTQDTEIDENNKLHQANLCCANIVCFKCYLIEDENYECEICKQRNYTFFNDAQGSCVTKLVKLCKKFHPDISQNFIFAHNFRGFDGHFVLRELIKKKEKIQPIMNGLKIISIKMDRVVFLDTLNFIAIPLAKFPDAFGLDKDSEKLTYPYLFNTFDNETYEGPMPDKKFYSLDKMSPDKLKEFNLEYDRLVESNYVFNNKRELERYCLQDCKILRLGAVRFMSNFEQLTGMNPFLHSVTLAHATLNVYRFKFMQKNSLAVLESENYRKYTNTSKIAEKWLHYENEKADGKIQTASHPFGEYKTERGSIICDGWLESEQTVYMFDGCFFHGCEQCFPFDELRKEHSLDDRLEATILRDIRLKKCGYNLVSIKECEFKQFLKNNKETDIRLNLEMQNKDEPLKIRDTLYGGRTECFRLYYECQPGEKIRYLDFTSLYGTVLAKCDYGVGHPVKILTRDEANAIKDTIPNLMGLVRCTVLAPKDLYLPVLPVKIHNKLFFALCRTCLEKLSFQTCEHTKKERAITGSFTTVELKKAIEVGYELLDVAEFWQYDVSNTLFNEFVITFLKEKVKNSGWGILRTEEEKDTFLANLKLKDGIDLKKDEIVFNPTMRFISKIITNCLYGKLTMRGNRPQTTIVYETKDFMDLMFANNIEVGSHLQLFDDSVWVNWKFRLEFAKPARNSAPQYGAWTTSHGRVMLYNLLASLPGKYPVLYTDTDSVIFISKDSDPPLENEGNCLGMLTNELEKFSPMAYCRRVVCLAPKCYSMEIYIPETDQIKYVTVSKGFKIDHENDDMINFDTLKSIVCDPEDPGFRTIPLFNKIKRSKKLEITSGNQKKTLGFSFIKRIVKADFNTFPFGFCTNNK